MQKKHHDIMSLEEVANRVGRPWEYLLKMAAQNEVEVLADVPAGFSVKPYAHWEKEALEVFLRRPFLLKVSPEACRQMELVGHSSQGDFKSGYDLQSGKLCEVLPDYSHSHLGQSGVSWRTFREEKECKLELSVDRLIVRSDALDDIRQKILWASIQVRKKRVFINREEVERKARNKEALDLLIASVRDDGYQRAVIDWSAGANLPSLDSRNARWDSLWRSKEQALQLSSETKAAKQATKQKSLKADGVADASSPALSISVTPTAQEDLPPAKEIASERPSVPAFLRVSAVLKILGISKSKLYDITNSKSSRYDPTFPRRVELGKRDVAYRCEEIYAWMAAREPK